ncbi:hypothetical protein O181_074560 [Austropuccinia psidii MF-1]|uniref:Uncharacterized protein n=1 Tax=Austropuccinia psidii MF-1 TaxID=1389203 RepID=A0A9Q3FCM8_9BASI|nr:hypothetical protein [Austropuccinia psidii MF-1]
MKISITDSWFYLDNLHEIKVLAPFYNGEPISEYVKQKYSPALKTLDLDYDHIEDLKEHFSPTSPRIDESFTLNSIDTFSSIYSTHSEHPHCEPTSSHDSSSSFEFIEQKSSPSLKSLANDNKLDYLEENVSNSSSPSLDESSTLNSLDSFSSSTLWHFNSESTLEYLDQTSSPILKSSIDDSVDQSLFHIPDIITSTIALNDDSPESLQPPLPVYCSPAQRFSPFCLPLSPEFSLDSDFKFASSGGRVIKIEDTSAEVDELDPVPYSMALTVVQSTSKPAFNTSPHINNKKLKKRKQI